VPDEGIEPPTNGLQNRCSTAELIRRALGNVAIAEAFNSFPDSGNSARNASSEGSPGINPASSRSRAIGGRVAYSSRQSSRRSKLFVGPVARVGGHLIYEERWTMKQTIACTIAWLMLCSTPVLACGTQLNPAPCEAAAGPRQMEGQFVPRSRPAPPPRLTQPLARRSR
jgi:hypothetical protein